MISIKFVIITAVPSSPAVLAASPVLADSKPARCFMQVEDVVYMDGTCEFNVFDKNDGSFFIKVDRNDYAVFADVDVKGNPSAWNEARDSHARAPLGVLERDPA